MKTVKLGDVASVGISGVDKKAIPGELPVRLCNYTDVYYNWAIRNEMREGFMQATARREEIEKYRLHAGQVALTKDSETRDDIGHAAYIAADFEDVILGYHCALITPRAGKLDGQYLNALFRTRYISDYLSRNAGGSGQRYYLSDSSIKDIPLFLPPIEAQLLIAGILGSLDEKIEINRRKIVELEAMAKKLYDYWFVQFDFLNANGKPYKSSGGKMEWKKEIKYEVPAGWEVGTIFEVSDLKVGGTPSKKIPNYWNGPIPFWGPTDYADGVFQLHTAETISQTGFEHCSSDLLPEYATIITARGSIGKVAMVGVPMAMNQSCFAFQAHDDNFSFVYFLSKQLVEQLKVRSSGSVFDSFVSSDLKNVVLPVGTAETRRAFSKLTNPIFQTIKNCSVSINELIQLRDTLLPLLMNGQVNVAG